MGTSGNSDCQSTSRCVFKDFTEDALTFSGDSLFRHGTARIVEVPTASLLMELEAWPCSPLRVGCAKLDAIKQLSKGYNFST